MKNRILVIGVGMIALALSVPTGAAAPRPAAHARAAVQAVLNASAAAWNEGNLDRFMACYERTHTTTYVSGSRFVRGYEAIRAMYAERFGGGSSAAMGRLSLEIVDFRTIGDNAAYLVGRFHLHRDTAHGGDASGPTTLLFEKAPAGWRIISDHS